MKPFRRPDERMDIWPLPAAAIVASTASPGKQMYSA
jgi:1,2-phenylacetyl-CoA epoxidase PaaB subunit